MPEQVKKTLYLLVIHTLLIAVALSCIFPFVWMINSSLKPNSEFIQDHGFEPPSEVNFENYIYTFTKGNLGTYFLNSILYTFLTVIAIVIISSLAGYGISRLKFKGKNLIFYMILAAMMIPIPAAFVPLYVLLKGVGLLNTRIGYILAMVNVGLSLSIYLYKTFFDQLPKDLEESARIDGCGKLRIWWHVMFPLAKPATGVVVIFNALNVWNELILALVILSRKGLMPLQVGLLKFSQSSVGLTQYTTLMAALTIAALPIIIIYLIMQKHIIKGMTAGATVG
ncbi:MAG: carbohydrate ABC transporter permease [Candidatus Omnitrophica bacterium]|nr:carbohydrate ABC transporter permease [Candidatus Omnitrophota bacterium]MCF7893813.1 carbohydrate ABC transporter permease [Candidatus Omnitrophota bacterium]